MKILTLVLDGLCGISDKAHCQEFLQQFEDSCAKLEDFVSSLEKEVKDRKAMVENLEQSEIFYDAQYGEARIVANVSHTYQGLAVSLGSICH